VFRSARAAKSSEAGDMTKLYPLSADNMTGKFELSSSNYYSIEADRHYMSCSLFDRFRECEHRAFAEITGKIERPKKEGRAFAVGHYVHSAFEGKEAFAAYTRDHWNEVYKPASNKKFADIIQADEMLAVAYRDPMIRKLIDLDGEAELIVTGTLFDVIPWRARFDKYITSPERVIIDWKTVADLYETKYDKARGEHVSFVRQWGYDRRAAVYGELERQLSGADSDAIFLLVCLSKQKPPGKEIISMNRRAELDAALEEMRADSLHFWRVMQGQEKPIRCERCAYCRSTKKITAPIDFTALDPGRT
jgi:hypothetical protein